MLKYAKVVDESTKVCEVGVGTNSNFYESIGMTLQEVEQAYDGKWYLRGFAPSQPTEEYQAQIQAKLTEAVQKVLDTKAQELLYDNCLSVCSYVDTGVPKFDAEGKAFRIWRSAVWQKGYEILADVMAGRRVIPTEAELLAELPKLNLTY